MQQAINVMAGVLLGPGPAVIIAFMISLLRMMLGLGTILAFPGSMVGAFLAGILYKKTGRHSLAATGEGVGTGVIGALFAVPFAALFLGDAVGAFVFIPPFLVSSISGSLLGWILVSQIKKTNAIQFNN